MEAKEIDDLRAAESVFFFVLFFFISFFSAFGDSRSSFVRYLCFSVVIENVAVNKWISSCFVYVSATVLQETSTNSLDWDRCQLIIRTSRQDQLETPAYLRPFTLLFSSV